MNRRSFIRLLGGAAASYASWPLAARAQQPVRKMLTKRLIAAALMLPMPNAYAETQAASNMITGAAAISLYKMHCRGKIPASAVETLNTTIREYGESRVVASMVEMGLQREKLGHALPFASMWKKSTSKNKRLFASRPRAHGLAAIQRPATGAIPLGTFRSSS